MKQNIVELVLFFPQQHSVDGMLIHSVQGYLRLNYVNFGYKTSSFELMHIWPLYF
jgi:hypothetical protein